MYAEEFNVSYMCGAAVPIHQQPTRRDLGKEDGLGDSNGSGRVVVVSGEATAKNVEQYVAQLQQEADKQRAEVDARFAKAKSLLFGK